MKISTKIYMIALFCITTLSLSQTVTNKDTLSGTELSIEMDAPISKALKAEEDKCQLEKTKNTASNVTSEKTPVKINTVAKTMSRSEMCRRNPKILGYKILVGIRKSNKEANELKAEFRRAYPRMRTMTDASLRPNYKILAGSYLKKESGQPDLRKVKRDFPDARLIQYQVYCVEAK